MPAESYKKPSPQNWQALFDGGSKAPVSRSKPEKPVPDEVGWLEPAPDNSAATGQAIPESTAAPSPVPRSDEGQQPLPEVTTLGSRANHLTDDRSAALPGSGAGPGDTLADDIEAAVIQVKNRYLLTTVKSGVLLIDQRGAYERIMYDQFHAALTKRSGASQQLLFPKTVTVSAVDYQLALDVRTELESVGFQFDELGANTFVIRGVPSQIGDEREEELFANVLAQLREETGRLKLDRPEALARSLARRSAPRHLKPLTQPERRALVDQLFASVNPSNAPGGEVIMTLLTLDKLAGLFKG